MTCSLQMNDQLRVACKLFEHMAHRVSRLAACSNCAESRRPRSGHIMLPPAHNGAKPRFTPSYGGGGAFIGITAKRHASPCWIHTCLCVPMYAYVCLYMTNVPPPPIVRCVVFELIIVPGLIPFCHIHVCGQLSTYIQLHVHM